jgi:hypothetical protein
MKAKDVSFHKLWRMSPRQPAWKPKLAEAIKAGNHALVALSEIAADLTDGSQEDARPGLLHAEKQTRHAGTHRFIVMHDMAMGDSRPSDAIEHVRLSAFQKTVMRTMRLARAALLHFLEVLGCAERTRPRDGKAVGRDARPSAPRHPRGGVAPSRYSPDAVCGKNAVQLAMPIDRSRDEVPRTLRRELHVGGYALGSPRANETTEVYIPDLLCVEALEEPLHVLVVRDIGGGTKVTVAV